MKIKPLVFALALLPFAAVQSATVVENFNSYAIGDLYGQSASAAGLTGSWSSDSASSYDVVSGDLVYTGLDGWNAQGGTGQHVGTGGSGKVLSGVTFTTAFSGSEIWFSFLIGNVGVNGIDLLSYRLIGVGTELRIQGQASAAGVLTNSVNLVVGKITLQAGAANDSISLWANPTDLDLLGTATVSKSGLTLASSLTGFTLDTYNAGSQLDYVVFADSKTELVNQLISVPEPSTWAMLVGGMGILAFGQRLRRRCQS